MLPTVLICAITCLTMIMAILFFPKLKLGKVVLDTYWLITLAGALLLILTKMTKLETITWHDCMLWRARISRCPTDGGTVWRVPCWR